MALALNHHSTHLRTVRRAGHLRLMVPATTPEGATPSRVAARPVAGHIVAIRPRAARRSVYIRRRLVVGAALVAVVFGVVIASRAEANVQAGASPVARYVVAQQGDDLWSIAERIAPTGNIPDVVDQLEALNGTSLRVGQVVLIP